MNLFRPIRRLMIVTNCNYPLEYKKTQHCKNQDSVRLGTTSMKTILEDMRSGQVIACEVPSPELRRGGILVRTAFSAISTGTERAKLEQGEKSLLGKAMARPDLVRQVVDFARNEGVTAAYQRVRSRLDSLSPLGYSCSGIVIAAAEDVEEFRPGDRVA